MFFWSSLRILDVAFYLLGLYFVYLFIEKKDISIIWKIVFGILFVPFIILTPTIYNLKGFHIANCESQENDYFLIYQYALNAIIFFLIVLLAVLKYRKADAQFKKQILLVSIGMCLFLGTFFIASGAGDLLDNFELEQYGLFGMTIFMGFLAYLIVRYHILNIKLIATQALVAALVILVGAELFFANNATNQILILITLAISLGFGYMLIKSVKLEVQRKEELQMMSSKLAVANDQLRKLDNAKTEFISIASHQLRTPLTAVKGFVSMLLEGTYGKVSVRVQDVLNKVYLSNERLVNLVEDLLNISRIESGRMEYKFEGQQIEDILKELEDTFYIIAKKRKLPLSFKLPPKPLPKIKVDAEKIKEVVSNLIDNALKYTKQGGVTVKAELLQRDTSPGDVIRITVSDTGIGIPSEELPYLFAKFSRGKDTNRLHVGGTGLGLYVGKFMIEAHHGKIWAESDGAEKGSRFIIELPADSSI